MIWFQLGREYKLSVTEILLVFSWINIIYFNNDFLIVNWLNKDQVLQKANNLWWTIKIVEIINNSIFNIALEKKRKFNYWLSVFWEKKNLKNILIEIKKEFKKNNISSRFINKDFKNLNSAQILWEKLLSLWTDFSYIYSKNQLYIWRTIWIQDINKYSNRDYQKKRDMNTWMLPPKLCQIMINFANNNLNNNNWHIIYDPFVWLWTILIESILMWNKSVFWSDINEKNVEMSKKNIIDFCNNEDIKILDLEIIKLNAKFINESIFFKKWVNSIVTEWYLWEIMTNKNISLERINKQKKSLFELYEKFFQWLKKINYSWNIVICFPFWEIKWKYEYFTEIYELLNKYCIIEKFLPFNFSFFSTTKSWSLLYKRDKQLVWREIFKLSIKNNY